MSKDQEQQKLKKCNMKGYFFHKARGYFFEKTNKTNKMLASKVKKEEREKAQINTINDDKGKKEHKYR